MAKREKKQVYVLNREQAEEAFAEYATTDARVQRITSKMDIEITKIREKFQDELAELTGQRDVAFDKLQTYAQSTPDNFTKKKSLEFAHGVIGYRTGTPALKTLKGHTWASCTKLIKAFMPQFIRTKEEPNKEAILNDRNNIEIAKNFEQCGIYVDQKETFYVEPKKEEALASS